ncbi:MAG: endolytic transglycosylase MltG [Muribaculaceae bacterium]|nr:endolytic transglycosylase MltG [Muribaculaceae bacterium]
MYAAAKYPDDDTRIYIYKDAPIDSVKSEMTSKLGPSYGTTLFELWRLLKGTPEKSYGSYVIRKGEKAIFAARRIEKRRQDPVKLVLTNIRTRDKLAEKVGDSMHFSDAEFLAAADSTLNVAGLEPVQLTASIFPDTYEFYWTTEPATVVSRLMKTHGDFWTAARKQKAAELGLTPEQVHTIASIVYCESKMKDEWGDIARLYLNRLQKGMPLQADPTVVFGIGDFSIRRVESRHLQSESPYNTYKNRGLPPGPIYMVERAVVDSVLNAPEREWLYMCARSDFSGYHDFAKDYNAHRINAARYHRALTARGL